MNMGERDNEARGIEETRTEQGGEVCEGREKLCLFFFFTLCPVVQSGHMLYLACGALPTLNARESLPLGDERGGLVSTKRQRSLWRYLINTTNRSRS